MPDAIIMNKVMRYKFVIIWSEIQIGAVAHVGSSNDLHGAKNAMLIIIECTDANKLNENIMIKIIKIFMKP